MDRKLSITCKNPWCGALISPVKRRNNSRGHSEYCSRQCYYSWSPGVESVYRRILKLKGFKHTQMDPREFMRNTLAEVYAQFTTWTARSAILAIKRQTFLRWLHHFEVGNFKKEDANSKCE